MSRSELRSSEIKINSIKRNPCRLSRFGANISDAHSCFIFLPSSLIALNPNRSVDNEVLEIAGFHSLSNDIIQNCRIRFGAGLVGWVAKHGQAIHVSPFDHDSRTLGYYRTDQQLKSLIGIPIRLPDQSSEITGVIACDSKKSFAFSKLQGKLLEDLAEEITTNLSLSLKSFEATHDQSAWSIFIDQAEKLVSALGKGSIELVRARITNIDQIESSLGTAAMIDLFEQLHRLTQQSIPPHCPMFRAPNGDILIALDNMMSTFFQNKLRSLAEHLSRDNTPINLAFSRSSFRQQKGSANIQALITATCGNTIRVESQALSDGQRQPSIFAVRA